MEFNVKATWLTLLVMSLASFITTFDTTFMNVAIMNLVQDLNTTVSAIQDIITIYALTMGCLMLLGAKLQDIIGRRKTFLIGTALYGVGALVATLSFNATMLLVGWSLLEGVGAALMMPATFSMITGTYEGDRRTFAIGLVGGVSSVAAAIGPILGGFLTTFLSWRIGFGMEVVLVMVMLLAGHRLLKFPSTLSWRDLDIWGTILSVGGLFLLVLGILQLNNINKWYLVPYLVISGLILLAVFYIWQQKRIKENKSPLFDVNLLKIRMFLSSGIVRFIGSIGLAGIIFIIPVFMGTVVDSNAFMIGLSLLPLTMSMLIFALLAPRITHYIKRPYLVSLGLVIIITGCLLLRNAFTLETTIMDLFPGTFLIGAGCGLSFILSIDLMMGSARQKQSDASGVVNTMTMTGWAMGTAIIGIILMVGVFTGAAASVENELPGKYSKDEIQQNLHDWVQKYQTTDLKVFKNDKSTIARMVDQTIAQAMNTTFYVLAFIFFLGLISSLFSWPQKK